MGRGLIIIERNKFGFVYVFSDRRAIKKIVISSTNMNRMAILLNSRTINKSSLLFKQPTYYTPHIINQSLDHCFDFVN